MKDTTPHNGTSFKLVTITLRYSVEQDRVRLDGADNDGKTLTFWLTARLLNRLIPHLIRRQADTRFSARNAVSTTIEESESSGKKVDTVRCEPGSPEVLVASVDVSTLEERLLLVFKDL